MLPGRGRNGEKGAHARKPIEHEGAVLQILPSRTQALRRDDAGVFQLNPGETVGNRFGGIADLIQVDPFKHQSTLPFESSKIMLILSKFLTFDFLFIILQSWQNRNSRRTAENTAAICTKC